MAKQDVTIQFTFGYDPKAEKMPVHIFLFKFFTAFDREHEIKNIVYKGKTKSFTSALVKDVALRKVDSVSDSDLPKDPEWLKDKTVLKGINKK